MCGIAAIYSREKPVAESDLRRATAALRHRGPDGQRQWISKDGRVGLGHARLSIIDLTGGDQPIAGESGTVHIVVNGEFYDFERIRRELVSRGHRFRTGSDSEIALHLWEERGVHGLRELRGEFAFVLWDEDSRTLCAVRDRFGIKPLFYAEHAGALYLASEAKALFAMGVPARWDQEAAWQAHTGPFPPDRTWFAGVRQVPPGYYLLATDHGLTLHRYWDFDFPPAGELSGPRPDAEHIAEFRAVLDEAVRLRLRADVPVGCYLSGGLDSAAVLGLAAQHAPGPIHAFTLTFDDEAYDEGAVGAGMAARAGAQFYPVPIRQADLAENFADAIAHAETWLINGHGVAKFMLSRAVRDAGYKVVFTGEGSDEILGGYPHFRRDVVLYNQAGQDPAEVQRMLKELDAANPVSSGLLLPAGGAMPLDSARRVLGYVPSWFETAASAGARRLPLLADGFRKSFAGRDPVLFFLNGMDVPGQLTGRDPLNQSLYLWAKGVLPNYILSVLGDRMEMAHSIEGRLPFLDHHVVEMLCRVPPALKVRGLTEKYLLREAVRDVITEEIYRRQKHPFLAPPMAARRDEGLFALLQDTLRSRTLEALPFYHPAALRSLLDRLPQMEAAELVPWDGVLTSVLSLCIMQERFQPCS